AIPGQIDQEKRLLQCQQLRKTTTDSGCLLIINDDARLAQQVEADGVHLGQEDGNITHARQLLGDDKIIGVSCYNKIELASQAADEGANYIAFGRFFPSRTKPNAIQAHADILHQAKDLQLPVVAIGGISQDNAPDLINAGADMVAVIDAIFGQSDIKTATQQFKNLFKLQG
ncbi:MAG: thiamine phosphate synthase, partial [Gammaproteobacteria bacterium]|nr:thiamine phosphate synthase [Gammaproteobacteria bacterium]